MSSKRMATIKRWVVFERSTRLQFLFFDFLGCWQWIRQNEEESRHRRLWGVEVSMTSAVYQWFVTRNTTTPEHQQDQFCQNLPINEHRHVKTLIHHAKWAENGVGYIILQLTDCLPRSRSVRHNWETIFSNLSFSVLNVISRHTYDEALEYNFLEILRRIFDGEE